MKVLFATTNEAKVKKYKERLEQKGIKIVTVKDLDFKLNIEENGNNAIENAHIKAKAYYDATNIITIGMDNCLFIEELPKEKQPNTHVRRINGKTLSDEEMIEHYTKLVKEHGGKLTAKWVYGMVIYNGKKAKEYTWSTEPFFFIDKVCKKRNPGYPLDSISIDTKYKKYFVELTPEDKIKNEKSDNKEEVIEFIAKAIKEQNS